MNRIRMLVLLGLPLFAADRPEVLYAPEAVYSGKPMTFRVKTHGHGGSLLTNGVDWVQWPAGPDTVLETTMYPQSAARVVVTREEEPVWTFHVVRPGTGKPFTQRQGFLEQAGEPVILLPEPKLPPTLDRRWETVALIRNKLFGSKPVLPKPLWLCAEASMVPDGLERDMGMAAGTRISPAKDGWFRLHGYLVSLKKQPASFVAVELDLHDLKRGMPPHVWIMKWQFVLQHLQALTGYEDGILLSPDVPADSDWYVLLEEELESLARANGLRFVDRSRQNVWKERLADGLSEHYRLPE